MKVSFHDVLLNKYLRTKNSAGGIIGE